MTNSERAAADQRLMDAMRKVDDTLPVYEGSLLRVCLYSALIPIWLLGNAAHRTTLRLDDARTLHRELGEALAAIEAQFGEKPDTVAPKPNILITDEIRERTLQLYRDSIMQDLRASAVHMQPPEDAPGTRETIWGSWSDTPTLRPMGVRYGRGAAVRRLRRLGSLAHRVRRSVSRLNEIPHSTEHHFHVNALESKRNVNVNLSFTGLHSEQ